MMDEMLSVVAEAETLAKSTEKAAARATDLISTDQSVALASAESARTVALSFETNGPRPNHKLGTGTCPFEKSRGTHSRGSEAHSTPASIH
jgi:hypothetical protein